MKVHKTSVNYTLYFSTKEYSHLLKGDRHTWKPNLVKEFCKKKGIDPKSVIIMVENLYPNYIELQIMVVH